MFITPSFKKSLIVEQFQGNYLKCDTVDRVRAVMSNQSSANSPDSATPPKQRQSIESRFQEPSSFRISQ